MSLYPTLPQHLQTSHLRKLILQAYEHGYPPEELAELLRVSVQAVTEVLRGQGSIVFQTKARLSSRQNKRRVAVYTNLVQGIREARRNFTNYPPLRGEGTHADLQFVEDDVHFENPITRRITSPPGTVLRSLADFFATQKTRKLILDPVIADMQDEYFQALGANRAWKARWIRLRGYYSFWQAWGFASFIKTVGMLWRVIVG